MPQTKNLCYSCNALCCREVGVSLGPPKNKRDWDEIKWLVSHKYINVYKDLENDWLVEFKTNCKYLDKKNRCKIYNKRHLICQEHKNDDCIKTDNDYHKVLFRSVEDVEKYLKKKKKSKK